MSKLEMAHVHSDQVHALPESEGVVLTRRSFLEMTGVAGAVLLTGCSAKLPTPDEEFPPLPDCRDTGIKPIESTPIGPAGANLLNLPWDMPGVGKHDGALRVTPIQTAVYNGKTNQYEYIQPFNTHYSLDGTAPFKLEIDATTDDEFSFAVAEALPLIHDGFALHGRGFRVSSGLNGSRIDFWDGETQQPKTTETSRGEATKHTITIERNEGQMAVYVDGLPLLTANMSTDKLWLGMSALGKLPADVTRLSLAAPTGELRLQAINSLQAEPCPSGLRTTATKLRADYKVGTAVSLGPLLDDPLYAALLLSNFNTVRTENALKPQFAQPEEGQFTLQETKQLVAILGRHGIQVHGHALIPNRSYPRWMAELPTGTAAEKRHVRDVMVAHIQGIMRALPEIKAFDVINEPFKGKEGWQDTPFFRAMGPDMINIAMQAAHEARPDAVLWLNENAMDKDDPVDERRFQRMLPFLIPLREQGMQVGLGFQGHVYNRPDDLMSVDHLRRRFQTLKGDGIWAAVTEMDVVPWEGDKHPPSSDELLRQARHFREIAHLCFEEGVEYSMWGIGSKYASTASIGKDGRLSYASYLAWGNDLQTLPVYSALQQAFR